MGYFHEATRKAPRDGGGGQVKAVIVAKLDRLTRSVKDLCELLERFERHVSFPIRVRRSSSVSAGPTAPARPASGCGPALVARNQKNSLFGCGRKRNPGRRSRSRPLYRVSHG